jgi:hypothetical protein
MVLFQAHAEYNQMREMVHHYQAKLAQVKPILALVTLPANENLQSNVANKSFRFLYRNALFFSSTMKSI